MPKDTLAFPADQVDPFWGKVWMAPWKNASASFYGFAGGPRVIQPLFSTWAMRVRVSLCGLLWDQSWMNLFYQHHFACEVHHSNHMCSAAPDIIKAEPTVMPLVSFLKVSYPMSWGKPPSVWGYVYYRVHVSLTTSSSYCILVRWETSSTTYLSGSFGRTTL